MTVRKEWFVKINQSIKNKVKFANDSTLAAEGISDVLIVKKDGKKLLISNMLYITGMNNNLLSTSQRIEKNHKGIIEDKMMSVFDSNGRLIMKALMSQNKILKIELSVLEHKCLATATKCVMALQAWSSQLYKHHTTKQEKHGFKFT